MTNYRENLSFGALVEFVLRVVMVDDGRVIYKIFKASRNNSLKLLGLIWMWACFVLIQSYSGNLTAILTRPILEMPINSIQDLINQQEFKWSLDDDGNDLVEYLKTSESLQPLYDLAVKDSAWKLYYQCFAKEEMDIGTYVSLCHYQSIRVDQSRDFSETGKCNFYTPEETFFTTPQVMAFKVSKREH